MSTNEEKPISEDQPIHEIWEFNKIVQTTLNMLVNTLFLKLAYRADGATFNLTDIERRITRNITNDHSQPRSSPQFGATRSNYIDGELGV